MSDMLDSAMDYLRLTGVPIDSVLARIRHTSFAEILAEYEATERTKAMKDSERKGGKPNPGTPPDRRLSENKPGGKKPTGGKPSAASAVPKPTTGKPPMPTKKP